MGRKHGTKAAGASADKEASATPDQKYNIGMAPLEFTRQQLVRPKSTITHFAITLINKNQLAGVELDRYDVVTMWWLNARKVFPRGDPKREELMDQIDSPLFHEFWARRAHDPEYKDESRAFRRAERVLSREEEKAYPDSFIMESNSLALLVPGVLNFAIQHITFMDMVRWVLEANLDQKIERSDMVSLWDAIIHIIYHFESSSTQEKKVRESEEANSFTLEEYERMVIEARKVAEDNESLTQSHKRVHLAAGESEEEDEAESEHENAANKRSKKGRARNHSAPGEDSVLPSIEFPPSSTSPAKAAPSAGKSLAKSRPATKPKGKSGRPEQESDQESGAVGQQCTRKSGNKLAPVQQ